MLCQTPREAGGADVAHTAWLETRLHALEGAMDGLQRASAHRLDALNGRLDRFAASVDAQGEEARRAIDARLDTLDGRMEKIEGMLGALLAHLGHDS